MKIKGTKHAFWAYMPASFAKQLKRFEGVEDTTFAGEKLANRIILPNQLRKWNAKFLTRQKFGKDYPELRLIDFVQGRVPKTMLREYYIEMLEFADDEYARIVDKFPI
jgi:intergrase/recombinase